MQVCGVETMACSLKTGYFRPWVDGIGLRMRPRSARIAFACRDEVSRSGSTFSADLQSHRIGIDILRVSVCVWGGPPKFLSWNHDGGDGVWESRSQGISSQRRRLHCTNIVHSTLQSSCTSGTPLPPVQTGKLGRQR